MLLPVIGIIQVGPQSMADRYTYLPSIGPFLVVTWFVSEKWPASAARTKSIALATGAIIISVGVITYQQVGYWKNGITLFSHALSVTEENSQAQKGLAIELSRAGRNLEALPHFMEALRIKYDDAETHKNLAFALVDLGQTRGAIHHLQEAVRLKPDDRVAILSLEFYLSQQKR
jgi:tetratricopeptide (TPR) repeat protein